VPGTKKFSSVNINKVAQKKGTRTSALSDAEYEAAHEMAFAYEEKLREYKRESRHWKFFKSGRLRTDKATFQHFHQAAKIATKLDMVFGDFMEAQFSYLHKWYGREPKTWELRSTKGERSAVWRAEEWRKENSVPQPVNAKPGRKRPGIKCHKPPEKMENPELVKAGQKQLEELMDAWGSSEEEILLKFGKPEAAFFHPVFLRQNKTWRSLVKKQKTGDMI